ncbi:hypothetical protein ACROYT_G029618 [Oculina patagonica]
MAVQYAPMKLRVPPGFQNLLEGLAREVLREQPEDIINFAAQYFRNQLLIREETGKDDAKKGDQMERLQKGEEVDIDLNDPEVQLAATKIQASFRGHKVREDVKKQKDEEAAAVKIQASFRGHQAREKVKDIKASQSQEQVSESVGAAGESGKVEETPDAEPAVSGDAEVPEEPETQEKASEDQVPDAQPDEPAAAEAEAVTQEAEAEKEEPTEQDGQPDEAVAAESAEAADAVDKEETEDAQAEETVTEEAAGETTDAAEKAEDAEKPGEEAADVQADGAAGGEVEGEAEEIDLDVNDPDLQSAVVKIQASFRGHKAREEVKAMKSSESLPQSEGEVASEEKPRRKNRKKLRVTRNRGK